ncbi:MAG TPA: sigma-70 family RNA polymerase sigma factor [Opitutales bacterium]|nr:sigma-70 family RNA polymerase sigma factor [Opitutales bacterium]
MGDREPVNKTQVHGAFPVTRWTLVQHAVGEGSGSKAALESLCRNYWYPLYSYARRSGVPAADAEDLTQGFFALLLEKGWLADADQAKGKLRTFLLTAFRRFQTNEWRKASTQRRGQGKVIPMAELEGIEERYADAHPGLSAEELFDRHWALALLRNVLENLESEFAAAGKAREYDSLKGVLMADRGELNYSKLAEALGTSEGAARVAAHRLRKKFRRRFREAISATLDEDADLTEEMVFMAKVLAD